MISSLIDLFVHYSKNTGPLRMLLHALILSAVITWMGVVFLVSTNFKTIIEIYENYKTAADVQVEKAISINTQTNKLIEEQRLMLGVDRLYVAKFHNGKLDLSGVHFLFFSRISEANGAGVSNEMNNTQNIPVGVFPDMLTTISQDECYYIEDIDREVENYTFLSDMGVRSVLVCPIRNSENKLIGILGAEGVRNIINMQERVKIEAAMIPLSTVLGGLLSTR